MFCVKCGTEFSDDGAFYPKCGVRRPDPEGKSPSADAGGGKAAKKAAGKAPKKKRGKKLVIGVVAVVAVLAVVLVGGAISDDNSRDTPTLFDLAEGIAPVTEYGYDATYGDILDWLIAGAKISLQQEGSVAYLTYSGNVTGAITRCPSSWK